MPKNQRSVKFFTVGEVAVALKYSADSIRRFEREGKLRAIRLGNGQRLFRPEDVEAFRVARERPGAGAAAK